jgi:hypothetical protein
MSFLYDADHGMSLRKLMEMEMSYHASELDRLNNQLFSSLVQYDAEAGSEVDVYMDYLPYKSEIHSDDSGRYLFDKIGFAIFENDWEQAWNTMPENGNWSTFRKLIELEDSMPQSCQDLDPITLSQLISASEDLSNEFCHFSRAMLHSLGFSFEDPIPVFPIQYRSLRIENDQSYQRTSLLGAWPNPVVSSTWIHYPIEADGIGMLRVVSPTGQLISEAALNSKGLIELIAGDQILESMKMTVVK